MTAAGVEIAVESSTAPAGRPSGKERRRKRTRWGPDAEDQRDESRPEQPSASQQHPPENGGIAAEPAAAGGTNFPGPPSLPGPPASKATGLQQSPAAASKTDDQPRRRKRSRWQPEEEQTPIQIPNLAIIPGMPGMSLPPSLVGLVDINPETMELHRRLNLVNQDIQTIAAGKFVDDRPESARSPSPDPIYNENGVRVNSRDQRAKEKLQKQRYDIITEIIKRNPNYKPPSDYRVEKKTRRIMIPVHDHPGYNFIGLILGPRGNTHRRMEAETGAKIFIRGRGSVKEGRERREKPDPSDNDDLHVQIIAEDDVALNKAATMLERLLSPVDDELNQHKQNQLIELAKINGTLRNDEYWQMVRDEKEKGDVYQLPAAAKQSADAQYRRDMAAMHGQGEMLDDEYSEFMKELGGETGTQPGRWQDRPVHASAAAVPPQNGPELPGPPPMEGLGYREPDRDMMRERERENSRDDPRNLYVGFLPPSIQEMGLQALFETIGPVLDCRLIYDRQSGQHKGYGFIKMAEEWMAYEAMQRLNTYMVDGKRIAVRRRMGRRNERDSAGMESAPWAQQGGYQSAEYGGQGHMPGGYPAPPYPHDTAEQPQMDPNGLPYPPPGSQGYPPVPSSAAATEAQPALSEDEEERPPGMEEPNEVESSAAPTDAVPGDEVAAQSQASTATEADPYASAAYAGYPEGYERNVHMDVYASAPDMNPSLPPSLPGPPPLDSSAHHMHAHYMYPAYPAWTSFDYGPPPDEEEPAAPGAEIEEDGDIPEDPGEEGQEAMVGAYGDYAYAYGDPNALGPEAYGYTAEEWAAWEAHAAVMQQAQNAEAETERAAEEARRSEALRPPEVKLRIPKKHRDRDLVVQVVKLTEEERAAAAAAEQAAEEAGSASDSDEDAPPGLAGIPGPPPEPGAPPPAAPAHAAENGEVSTAADEQAGGDKRRRRRSGRGKAKPGEADSIILKDELAGPMRSAGPIRTAADMHRMAEEATRAAQAQLEARRLAKISLDMPNRPRAYRPRRTPSPSRSPSPSPSPYPSPEPVKEPTPEPSEDGELPAESGELEASDKSRSPSPVTSMPPKRSQRKEKTKRKHHSRRRSPSLPPERSPEPHARSAGFHAMPLRGPGHVHRPSGPSQLDSEEIPDWGMPASRRPSGASQRGAGFLGPGGRLGGRGSGRGHGMPGPGPTPGFFGPGPMEVPPRPAAAGAALGPAGMRGGGRFGMMPGPGRGMASGPPRAGPSLSQYAAAVGGAPLLGGRGRGMLAARGRR